MLQRCHHRSKGLPATHGVVVVRAEVSLTDCHGALVQGAGGGGVVRAMAGLVDGEGALAQGPSGGQVAVFPADVGIGVEAVGGGRMLGAQPRLCCGDSLGADAPGL